MYYTQRRAFTKRSRDTLVLVILLLLIALIVTGCLYAGSVRRGAYYSDVLLSRGADELGQARASMSQISRIGGSYTTVQISKLRQHLYAIDRLNAIATEIYGANKGIIDDSCVASALDTIGKCESRLLKGQAIDEQLATLRQMLDQIDVQLSARRL
ncbi:hypothetical protein AGMMS49992_00450 [Clostridia bacterium]|nr:hypothetical protein AGMMS49992_00450 [Clostridia bacterium]